MLARVADIMLSVWAISGAVLALLSWFSGPDPQTGAVVAFVGTLFVLRAKKAYATAIVLNVIGSYLFLTALSLEAH